MHRHRSIVFLASLLVAALAASPVFGSAIVGRNLSRPTLTIDRRGHAHVSYLSAGRRTTLVASGAIPLRKEIKDELQTRGYRRYVRHVVRQ